MKFLTLFVLVFFSLSVFAGGYTVVRVYDTNKYASTGTGFLGQKIQVIYDNGTVDEIDMLPFSDKNSIKNLTQLSNILNQIRAKGYKLISSSMTGEQGNMIYEYIFEKEGK